MHAPLARGQLVVGFTVVLVVLHGRELIQVPLLGDLFGMIYHVTKPCSFEIVLLIGFKTSQPFFELRRSFDQLQRSFNCLRIETDFRIYHSIF